MFIADLHIHSKYSRATSRECVPEFLELWARRKGLDLIGTGDFTHPAWRAELKEKLASAEEGLYVLKKPFRKEDAAADGGLTPRFILSAEISSIYKKNGKVRKVHNLILLPCMEDAEALSRRLEAIGNLHSDGRPILGLDSRDLLQITLDVCPEAIFIPAHIWTPHFSLFGAYSGFDDIAECFEDLTGRIHALETGLSSDPPMNWRLSALDGFSLVSNSDAHSPANLAREANLFDTGLSYPHLSRALQNRHTGEFYGTLEFFPEEGKYHCDGHRNCKVCLRPAETKAVSGVCPVCGGRITVGVLHRVEALADRGEGFVLPGAKRFERLIPLHEVIAASMGRTTASVKVKARYDDLLRTLGPELFILRQASLSDIRQAAGILIAEGIDRLRRGKVEIRPGYDGEYGKIKILAKTEIDRLSGQLCFLPGGRGQGGAKPKETRAKREPAPKAVPVPADTQPRGGKPDAGQKPGEDAPYGLNREQWEAVSAGQPAVAVIAGPGTGKTKTLVSRIAYLIEKRGVQPSEIAAVTFTNKAAGEMRARLEKHFGNRRAVQAMTIGTFHSICLRVLSEHRGKISVPVIDQPDALSIVKDVLHTLGLKNPPRDVLRGISLRKNGEENPDIPPGVYELYQAQLAQYGVLDYDDILLEALALFENDARDDAEDRRRPASFSYILVDEFQDINALQYRLIWAWSANSAGIFVIGDPDQSIYGFRGADPRCFERFLNDYNPVRRVHLTQNYRSTPEILRCARSLMSEKTAVRHGLEARRESGPNVRLLDAEDAFAEALFVAKEINRMVGGMDMLDAQASKPAKGKGPAGQPRSFSDIAVLYRTNRQADILEQCLQKESIPYVVAGQDDFLMEAEVRGAVAFFRFLLDPGDLVSLRNCLKNAGVGQADIGRAMEGYAAAEKSVSGLARVLNGISGGRLPALVERLGKYEPLVCSEKPWKLMERWMEDDGPPESGCMEMLLNTSVMYDSMQSLLHNLVLGRESDLVRSGGRKYAPDAVSLMTLHGAKGLEFPAVFLCGVTEGLIPFQKRGGGCDMDEERRLFYVGMTRAKDELILLTSPAPSPFLAGLPPDALITGEALARRQAMPKQTSFLDV
jgi:uncharacterized protein (TIGR00375 family)